MKARQLVKRDGHYDVRGTAESEVLLYRNRTRLRSVNGAWQGTLMAGDLIEADAEADTPVTLTLISTETP